MIRFQGRMTATWVRHGEGPRETGQAILVRTVPGSLSGRATPRVPSLSNSRSRRSQDRLRRSWVTTAPDDLRMGPGKRWPCRSGAGRAAPEPLSAPPSLGWSLGGQGAGGRAMVTHSLTPHPTPPPAGLDRDTGPRASQHPQSSASGVSPTWVTPTSPCTGVHLTLGLGGCLACFPAPPPFLLAWCFRLGAPACGRGGRNGKGFLSQQPRSRKTG